MNLDPNSAFFDPKSRAMHENPNVNLPPEKQVYKGLNELRLQGDVKRMLEQERFAWEHVEKNNLDINTVADPSLAERMYKVNEENRKKNLTERNKNLIEKYGSSEQQAPQ